MERKLLLLIFLCLFAINTQAFCQAKDEVRVKVYNNSSRGSAEGLTVTAYYLDSQGKERSIRGYAGSDGTITLKIPKVQERESASVYIEVGYISDKWREGPISVDNGGEDVSITYGGINPNWEDLPKRTYY